jgi:hypothetical protein
MDGHAEAMAARGRNAGYDAEEADVVADALGQA